MKTRALPATTTHAVSNCARALAFVAALACTTLSEIAAAHDNWIEVERFVTARAPNGAKIYLLTGEHFTDAEPLHVRRRETYTSFRVLSSAGARDVASEFREDQAPLAAVSLGPGAGSFLVQLEAAPKAVELTAEHFGEYLLEERLIDVLMLRAIAGTEDAPGRERYSRSLKAIVQVGPKLDAFVTQPTGAVLEVVPLSHPHSLVAGPNATLTVQVLFKGKPLAGRALMAANRFRKDVATKTVRTDANGKAMFTVKRAGDWMFRLVHMEASAEPDVDWRSYWTSMTFSLGES